MYNSIKSYKLIYMVSNKVSFFLVTFTNLFLCNNKKQKPSNKKMALNKVSVLLALCLCVLLTLGDQILLEHKHKCPQIYWFKSWTCAHNLATYQIGLVTGSYEKLLFPPTLLNPQHNIVLVYAYKRNIVARS